MSQKMLESKNLNEKKASKVYARGFGEEFEEGIYWDPLEIQSSVGTERVKKMKEAYEPVFESLKEKGEKGKSLMESTEELKEAYDTGRKSLPIFVRQEYFVTERNRTPIYDLLPHEARDRHKIFEDNVAQLGSADVIGESGVYTENDDTVESYEFEINEIVHRKNTVTDLVELAEPRMSVRDSVVERQMEAIAKLYEKIAIQGSNVTGVSAGADGKGLDDYVKSSNVNSVSDTQFKRSNVRSIIENLTDFEYDEDQIMIFCSNSRFQELKADLEQNVRYPDPDVEEAEFGFKQMRVDGARVIRTSGLSSENDVYGIIDEAFYWHDLQPPTVHPLAKVDSPSEKMATDAYQQFVTRSKDLVYKLTLA